MSRIGRKPIPFGTGVTVTVTGNAVTVKGPKGTLSRTLPAGISAAVDGNIVTITRASDHPRHKALHGLSRTLVANMVQGVSQGYSRALEIQGVGYKAEPKPYGINLVVGFSHPVPVKAPAGIKFVRRQPDRVADRGDRQGTGGTDGGRNPQHPSSRTVQGQGRPLRR